jgi:hypothetical protein
MAGGKPNNEGNLRQVIVKYMTSLSNVFGLLVTISPTNGRANMKHAHNSNSTQLLDHEAAD